MGRSLTFELIAPLTAASSVIDGLCALLVAEDAARLSAAYRQHGVDFLRHLPRSQAELKYHASLALMFTYRFPPDEALLNFALEQEQTPDPVAGQVAIGYVDTRIELGRHYLLLRASSATSSMAELFAESGGVRGAFIQLAQASGACLLQEVDDWGDARLVWNDGQCQAAKIIGGTNAPERVDQYCQESILALMAED